jgi:hypothetical protein
MSEYQYYEFRAVDRPLTDAQMAELRKVSSRGEVTPSSFVNEYNYGDFKGKPKKWMELYFDGFVYLANWGSRWLMLRVPASLLDETLVRQYLGGEHSEFWKSEDHLILSFRVDEEDPDWEEGSGWLSSLVSLRDDLLRGDYRCLYLAWLLNAGLFSEAGEYEELDDEDLDGEELGDEDLRAKEPPVPPGLGELSAPLQRFADFLLIDDDLIAAAAERSGAMRDTSIPREAISRWVSALPVSEKDAILLGLIDGDSPHPGIVLRRRMERDLRQADQPEAAPAAPPRSLGALLNRSEALAAEWRRAEEARQAEEKARKEREDAERRREHLDSLVGQEKRLWAEVNTLIETKLPKSYDRAVELLTDLRDLAEMSGAQDDYSKRVKGLSAEHERKRTFISRLRKATLLRFG